MPSKLCAIVFGNHYCTPHLFFCIFLGNPITDHVQLPGSTGGGKWRNKLFWAFLYPSSLISYHTLGEERVKFVNPKALDTCDCWTQSFLLVESWNAVVRWFVNQCHNFICDGDSADESLCWRQFCPLNILWNLKTCSVCLFATIMDMDPYKLFTTQANTHKSCSLPT